MGLSFHDWLLALALASPWLVVSVLVNSLLYRCSKRGRRERAQRARVIAACEAAYARNGRTA
jgi:hypothetical protein